MIKNFTDEEFPRFLIHAKRGTYAAQGDDATRPPLVPGAKQLECAEGPWLYRDLYFGFARFAGQEVIYHRQCPIWSMTYAGECIPASKMRPKYGKSTLS